MKLIILAAGKGSRLGELTKNTPKPLVDLGNGKTLLETQLENIWASGAIDEVVLVVGYCGDQIEAKIKKYQKEGKKIKTLFNPFYDLSNNLISLWLAKSEMNEDFIITNGDNIFDKSVFSKLCSNKKGIYLTTSHKDEYNEDDMKVIIKEGLIEKVSKLIKSEDADAESVGLVMVSGDKYREAFKESLESLARDPTYLNKFWLEVFNHLSSKGLAVSPFEINGKEQWVGVDFHGDLNDLLSFIKKEKDGLSERVL